MGGPGPQRPNPGAEPTGIMRHPADEPTGLMRNPADEPTNLLPPVGQPAKREPELLTHREPDEVVDAFYEEDGEYEDSDELTEEEARALRKKKIWRRVRRTAYVAAGLMIIAPAVAFAIAYQVVEIPEPAEVQAKQGKAVTLLYSDGTEMTKIAPQGSNRELIKYEDLTEDVKHAVFAAEDASYETNPGFDTKAIVRAAWIQVSGGESGGSGLTQQYVKQATDDDSPTLSRKFTEVVKAYKMNNQKSKEEILAAYLNTIYEGRSAFGIKAAAKMYYNKDLKDLSPSEAALIAGLIQNPSRSEEQQYPVDRWKFTMGQMLEKGWITKEYHDAQTFPTPLPYSQTQQTALEGVRRYIQTKVEEEMGNSVVDIPIDKALKMGITIHTTIDPKSQKAAEDAVAEVMEGQPEELRYSLSAIDPASGAVKAYWAGKDGTGLDYATGTLQEPGSSFKPFDLVAALQKGKGVGEIYDGSSPRTFPGRGEGNPVRNASACSVPKQCSVREAMVKSVNTVFFDMAINTVNTKAVAEAAHEAGIPPSALGKELLVGEDGGPPDGNISIGGGTTQVRPFDMASAYATFAARGVYHEPYFITKIEGPDGRLLYQHADKSTSAFDPDPEKSGQIADNVTDVLKAIPASSNIPCADKRDCAGKTGTHELENDINNNSRAWMVGYTPTLAASVYMGTDAGNVAIRNAKNNPIFGSGLPGQIWQKFMDKALEGAPMDKFPKAKMIGKSDETKPSLSNSATTTTTTTERVPDRPTETTTETTTTTTKPPKNCGGVIPCPPTTTTTTDQQGNALPHGRDPNDG
jgi:membrane peptidoglycan carboxypeptidase